MTQKTEPVLRDTLILVVAVVACALIGLFGTNELISEKWRVVGFVTGGFIAQILVKLAMPDHSIQRLFSWAYMLSIMVLACVAAVLLSDWTLLGAWTLPAIAGLLSIGWIVRAKLGPKTMPPAARDDGGSGADE